MTARSRLGAPPLKPRGTEGREVAGEVPRREVTALELVTMPTIPLWDVRPFDERTAEPGYIPGSRAVPMGSTEALALPWDKIVQNSPYVVLVCLSGRRTEVITNELWAAGHECVLQLNGGVLGWQASGFSLCIPGGEEPPDWASVTSLQQFRRAVVACFVAEAVMLQSTAPRDEFISPKSLVERVLAEPGALDTYDGALCTLDLLAENARRLGYPVDRLGLNLSVMRRVLERLGARGQLME